MMPTIKKAIVANEEFEEFKLLHSGYDTNTNNNNQLKQLTEEEIEKAIIEKKKEQILKMLTNL